MTDKNPRQNAVIISSTMLWSLRLKILILTGEKEFTEKVILDRLLLEILKSLEMTINYIQIYFPKKKLDRVFPGYYSEKNEK